MDTLAQDLAHTRGFIRAGDLIATYLALGLLAAACGSASAPTAANDLGASGSSPTARGNTGTSAPVAGLQDVGTAGARSMAGAPSAGRAAAGAAADSRGAAAGGSVMEAGSGALAGAGAGSGAAGSGGTPVTASSGGNPAATCGATFTNPVIWEDLPDLEVIRVGATYYYTASSFHHSPGAPILRSTDLVNWDFIGHSVPVLDFNGSYSLTGGRAYVNGVWASSLRYRQSNQTFYWIGCMHGGGGGYVFTAKAPEGPWTKHPTSACYHDVGLLIDDDDTMYLASGNNVITVTQLSQDGFSPTKSQQVFTSPSNIGPLEGSRFYKTKGNYYILVTQYANGEYVLRSTGGPFGPYTLQPFAVKLPFGGSGAGGSPHQGGLVDTQNGDWYYMAFNDSYPAGRLPVLMPIAWKDGWPSTTLVDGKWGGSYPFPNLPCGAGSVRSSLGTDTFSTSELAPAWEWNHNPDNSKWTSGSGLTLQTVTMTSDLYAARNTLTRRIPGPTSTATIELDYSAMKDGDVAGLAALRDSSAWIGIKRVSGSAKIAMVNNLTLNNSWATTATGTEVASASVSGGRIWLRVAANIRTDTGGGNARFSYSTDGTQFTPLGNSFSMKRDWQYFLGYRFGIFNYATQSLGGSVKIASFTLARP